ncbi:DUF4355 domain-containing protein [Adlercreutzia muris]|uniref:DUF4355 domain-containing protein n=1 Tax=Adlercreutzia muris TaxID=1796610 RepID=UPI003517D564
MDEEQKKQQEAAEAAEAAKKAAEDAAKKDNSDGDAGSNDGNDKGGAKDGKTDAEVDAIVEKRLARERAKMEREIRQQIANEAETKQTEAEKLKSMTALQRAEYEADKLKKELKEKQSQIDLSEQTAIARNELASAGIVLGDKLLAMFVSPEAEKTSTAIDELKELWPKAVNDAVQKELKRDIPDAAKAPGQKSFGASFAEQYTKSKNGGKE